MKNIKLNIYINCNKIKYDKLTSINLILNEHFWLLNNLKKFIKNN